jgi:tRNA nucleotidyltransferase/poly(A) polymerase
MTKQTLLGLGFEIINILSEYGEAYIVGGAVRDDIMKLESSDVDISTNVPMDKIEELFPTHDIGKNKDFGIVVINYKGHNFEIAQFRIDGDYSDGRRPDSVQFSKSFTDDLKRRDFTINAMMYDKDKNLKDYFGGKQDLKKYKLLRTLGNPNHRFEEDYLRMLRAIRFATRFNLNIDLHVLEAIENNSIKILEISPERIWQEIWKMAKTNGTKFSSAMKYMKETGLLKHIFPILDGMCKFSQPLQYHPEGNVWEHTLRALESNVREDDPFLNIAILFHDIGKPSCFKIRKGNETFYGHAKKGSDIIKDIAAQYRISNNVRDALMYTTGNHMKMHLLTKMKPAKIARMMQDSNWEYLVEVAKADILSRGCSEYLLKEAIDEVKEMMLRIESMKNYKNIDDIRKLVNGRYVMNILDMKKGGPELGIIIKNTVDFILNNNIDLKDTGEINKIIAGEGCKVLND